MPSGNHQISKEDEQNLFKYGVSVDYAEAKKAQALRDRNLWRNGIRERKEQKKRKKEKIARAKTERKNSKAKKKGAQVDEENEDGELEKLVKKKYLSASTFLYLFYRESAHLLRSKWLEWDRYQSTGTKNAMSVEVDDSFCLTSDWKITQD